MTDTLARLQAALADRYRVDRELGAGGMATVYLAHDLRHERDVAIKVLHPDLGAAIGADRFLSEIKTTAKLQHPHILPLLDSGAADGLLFYVMPYVKGETLRGRLTRETQLPLDDVVRIASDVAEALAEAHAQDIVHRDIKPENILLQGGRAIVADFGIALAVQQAGGARMTQTGLSLGTPQYMAPEQAMGERQIDARADVYALGALTYEMLVGDPPFTGSSVQAIVARVLTERPASVRAVRETVPAGMERAVLRALAKLPADRWSSARDFADALRGRLADDTLGDTTDESDAKPSAPRGVASVRRWQLLTGTTALVALVAIGAAVMAWRGRGDTATAPASAATSPQQFEVRLPDSVRLYDGGGRRLALSADGRRMLVVGTVTGPTGGAPRLFWRELADAELQPIAGNAALVTTTGGVSPWLSRDGTQVVFNDGTRIWSSLVTDGSRRFVADSGIAPVFTDGGEVLFVRAGAIWRAPAQGGAPQRLVRPDSARGWNQLAWPAPMAGGTHALVTIDHSPGARVLDSLTIGVIDLEQGTLTDTGIRGMFPQDAGDGWILFGQAGSRLSAARLDRQTFRVVEPPRIVLTRVLQASGGATGFAVSGALLLYAPLSADVNSNVASELVALPPSGASYGGGRIVAGNPAALRVLQASPVGTRIMQQDVAGGAGASVLDVTTQVRDQVVAPGEGVGASFSHDGRQVLFIRTRTVAGVRTSEVVGRWLDRSRPDSVLFRSTTLHPDLIMPGPSATAMVIRTGADVMAGTARFHLVPLDGLGAPQLIDFGRGRSWDVRLSPDGRHLAYINDETGNFEVYVRPVTGSGPRVRVSTSGGVEPVWTRDGRTLYYRSTGGIYRADLDAARAAIVRTQVISPDPYDRTTFYPSWDLLSTGEPILVRVARASGRVRVVTDWRALLRDSAR